MSDATIDQVVVVVVVVIVIVAVVIVVVVVVIVTVLVIAVVVFPMKCLLPSTVASLYQHRHCPTSNDNESANVLQSTPNASKLPQE
jgi:hypothetical protein